MAVTINGTTGIVTPDIGVDGSTLVIDSANNRVGIGTTSPATTLDVAGTGQFKNNGSALKIESVPGNNFTQVQLKNDGGSFYIGRENNSGNWFATGSNYASVLRSDGSYPMIFRVNGANRLSIASDGSVGIGTETPRSITNFGSFAINGTAGSFTDYFLNGTRTGTTAVDSNGFTSEAVGSLTPFRVITNGLERLRIASNGNICIGSVVGTTSINNQKLLINDTVEGGTAYAYLHNNSYTAGNFRISMSPRYSFAYNTSPYVQSISESTSAALTFGTTTGGSATEKLRITSSGNVGIGTDNPKAQTWRNGTALDVYGGSGNVVGNLHIGANRGDGVQTVGSLVFYDNTQDTNHKVISIIESDKTGSTSNQRGGTVTVYVKEDATVSNSAVKSATFTANGISFPSGQGIDFSATSDATGKTSELLDDYEEGTWTPTITFGGNAVGLTYTRQIGKYVRIGNIVTVVGHFQISAVGSSTGSAVVNGLPFSYAAITGGYFVPMGVRGRLDLNGAESVSFFVSSGGGSSLPIYSCSTTGSNANANVTHAAFAINTEIDIHVSYCVD